MIHFELMFVWQTLVALTSYLFWSDWWGKGVSGVKTGALEFDLKEKGGQSEDKELFSPTFQI